ncbi:hypothetical protein SOCE26_018710 [Sorangium cellulosum]|uniref:Uncharacterized protein n=1 Tax=Sorangium cellulosum TaxID=56 RepID=A0A2L0EMF8_SORCE|nr:hypothetical protein SOCE26_018710 [Sorangium cellulosum]
MSAPPLPLAAPPDPAVTLVDAPLVADVLELPEPAVCAAPPLSSLHASSATIESEQKTWKRLTAFFSWYTRPLW